MSSENQPDGGDLDTLARLRQPAARRDFLRWSGAGAVALIGLGACSDDTDVRSITEVVTVPSPPTPPPTPPTFAAVNIDFSTDVGILNYAFALEQLEAAFYTMVTTAGGLNLFSGNEQRVLTDLRDHEIAHREFFKAAIPAASRIPDLTPNFDAIDFRNTTNVLTVARTFEDLGVAAYNGAGPLFSNTEAGRGFLTIAGKIVSVEARHASAIRDIMANKTGAFAPQAFDDAMTPQQVLAQAAPFIRNRVSVTNVRSIG